MALMTPQEYIESLRKLNTRVYMFGEKIENWVDHPMIRPSINCVAMTYALAQDPQYAELMTVKSSLTGHTINRFTHLHQSTEDLMNKVKMQRLLGQKTASCFQRCVGMDAFNSVFSTTYEIDEKYGTHYHENFKKFLTYVQDNDLTVDGAMTDPKGDRSKSPSQQADPDMYVHVVERRPDGIVVCGAKCHQTGSINSHWHIFMPTISMGEADKDWAVSFACPTDAEGMYMIYGRQSCDTRKMEEDASIDVGNAKFGGQEALVVLDHVFIPNEYIFLNGEYEFAGMMVERFAGYHRQSYGGCKVGVGDTLIGAAALAAALISIASKEWMYHYTMHAAREINSTALKADAWHHRSDALSSVGAFVGILGARKGLPVLDSVASLVICLFVVKASYDVKVNDIIQIQFGQRTVKVQVLNLNETVKKENATEMYKDLS